MKTPKCCAACGRPEWTLEEFKKVCGDPLFFMLEQYDEYKKLKEKWVGQGKGPLGDSP